MKSVNNKLLKVEEVASKMRVNRRTVQTWIESGNLAATDVRPDGAQRAMWRIESSDLAQFAKRRKKERQN